MPPNVYLHTEEDLIQEAEIIRAGYEESIHNEDYIEMQNEPGAIQSDKEVVNYQFTDYKSKDFDILYLYTDNDGIYNVRFVSKTREYPNSELIRHKQIYSYGWKDDSIFIYSVKGEGIFEYNAKTRTLDKIIEGIDDFLIKKIEDNTIFYDDTKIVIK